MDRPFKPGEWIDNLPEPLDTIEDDEDLSAWSRRRKPNSAEMPFEKLP
jgi:hypothetical protein